MEPLNEREFNQYKGIKELNISNGTNAITLTKYQTLLLFTLNFIFAQIKAFFSVRTMIIRI